MKRILVVILYISVNICLGQTVVHNSSHILKVIGTWDNSGNPKRAQFTSGNNNIEPLFNNNFKITMERLRRVSRSFVELSFIVTEEGKLDSVLFLDHSDRLNDFEAIRLLSLTDGAWRPGTVNRERIREKMLIKYFFYDNAKTVKVDKIKNKATDAFKKSSYEKSIDLCDQILKASPFELQIIELKYNALIELDRHEEACALIKTIKMYSSVMFNHLRIEHCSRY